VTVRPEIVSLLLDVNYEDGDLDWTGLVHKDGRPFTEAETELAGQARLGELKAVQNYLDNVAEIYQSYSKVMGRVHQVALPYWEVHGADTRLSDLMPLMTEADRVTVLALTGQLPEQLEVPR
jgi:hypothetical protein